MRSDQIVQIKLCLLRPLRSDASCAFQTRNEQGRFSRERGCLCLGTRAGSYAQLLIPSRTRQHSIAEMYSETNDICWKIGLIERSLSGSPQVRQQGHKPVRREARELTCTERRSKQHTPTATHGTLAGTRCQPKFYRLWKYGRSKVA